MPGAAVLAAGVGIRRGRRWVLRAASFRVGPPLTGRPAVGIASTQPAAATAVVRLLAGALPPAHGELRVLGEDLTSAAGRAAVRKAVGVARRSGRRLPGSRVRGMISRAARLTRMPGMDREALTAAILDRLALTAWAEVPVRSAPDAVARRVRMAAAAVGEPALLLLDGLFDNLGPFEAADLADAARDLSRDTAIIVTGCDAAALARVCDEVLTISDGVLVGN